MKIIKMESGDRLIIALESRLDTATAPQLEKELKDGLEGVRSLIID